MQPSNPFVSTLTAWIEIFMRRSMRNFILYSKHSGLSMSQVGAMFHMRRMGACAVSDIGDDLGVTSAAASQMLERLVQQDLIHRSEDPHDRRVKQVVLTAKGIQILEGSILARQSWLEELALHLNPEEQAQVITALNILIDKANQLDFKPETEG